MAISNCWGLFLIILLLGYGLVALPRNLWYMGDLKLSLDFIYLRATVLEESRNDADFDVNELIKQVFAARSVINQDSPLDLCIEQICQKCPSDIWEKHEKLSVYHRRDALQQLGEISKPTLVKLHEDLMLALNEHKRSRFNWEKLVSDGVFLEHVIEAYDSEDRCISGIKQAECMPRLDSLLKWTWYTRLRPFICRFLSLICGLMSVLIILGETTLFLKYPIGLFPLLFIENQDEILSEIYCLIPLVYMMLATKIGLFSLKLNGLYGLYPYNQTDPSNLVWSAFFITRLIPPLAYNFLMFVKMDESQFNAVMNVIDIVPIFGKEFAMFFPLSLLLFCTLNYFNVYGRCMRAFGLNIFSFSDKFNHEKINEGKLLIQKARSEKPKMVNSSIFGTKLQSV